MYVTYAMRMNAAAHLMLQLKPLTSLSLHLEDHRVSRVNAIL
jgi:hypothetical protein